MNTEELAAIKERCEKATPGPWYGYEERESSAEGYAVSTGPNALFTIGFSNQDAADMDFISHSRTDIPALVAEVERLRQIEEAAKAVRVSMTANGGVDEDYGCYCDLVAALDAAEGGAT